MMQALSCSDVTLGIAIIAAIAMIAGQLLL